MINPMFIREREMSKADLDAIGRMKNASNPNASSSSSSSSKNYDNNEEYDVQEASWLRALGEGAVEGLVPGWLRTGVTGVAKLVSSPFKEHLEDKVKEWRREGKTDSEIETLSKEWRKNHREKVYTYSNGKKFAKNAMKLGTSLARNYGLNYALNAWDANKAAARENEISDLVRKKLNIKPDEKLDLRNYSITVGGEKHLLGDLVRGTPDSDRRALGLVSMLTQGPLSAARRAYNIQRNAADTSNLASLLNKVVLNKSDTPYAGTGSGYRRRHRKASKKKTTKRRRR